jgi:hypothetical protein
MAYVIIPVGGTDKDYIIDYIQNGKYLDQFR